MGGLKNMTRGNFVTPTNASVTQDPLGNNLKKTTLGCNWVGHFKYYHYSIVILSYVHHVQNFSLLHNKKLVFKGIHYSV